MIHEFYMVTPLNIEAAMKAAFEERDQSARLSLIAVDSMLKERRRRRENSLPPMRCMCCDFLFDARPPTGFGVVVPAFPDAQPIVVAHGICLDCLQRDDLEQALLASLHELFPGGSFSRVGTLQ